ncbi:MAG: branched-chain amino acid ABC transporter permease, partial [Streptomyces sp.]|nr:branched-chain amino acid ABC transporter permease [Streptomyces sp.]
MGLRPPHHRPAAPPTGPARRTRRGSGVIRMTTNHTTAPLLPIPPAAARTATLAGSALALAGTFLPWTWTKEFPGDLT